MYYELYLNLVKDVEQLHGSMILTRNLAPDRAVLDKAVDHLAEIIDGCDKDVRKEWERRSVQKGIDDLNGKGDTDD